MLHWNINRKCFLILFTYFTTLKQFMPTDSFLQKFHPLHADGLKRLGHKYDGGYVIHAPSLKDADYLVNYGIGYNVDFEKDFFKETGIPTLAFDPTLKDVSPFFNYIKKGEVIPFLRYSKNFFLWKFKQKTLKKYNINYIEEGISDTDTDDYKSLAYHLKKYGLTDKNIILKIDVEGAEYPVFSDPAVFGLLHNCIQLIVEFHNLNEHMDFMKGFMTHIAKTHSLIHIHSNNHAGTFKYKGKDVPETLEATFLLNKYLPNKELSKSPYPVPGLDAPSNKTKKDIELAFFY